MTRRQTKIKKTFGTKTFVNSGGEYSSKINSILKHLVRNDRGAIQKQHKNEKTEQEHVLAQHDRGAIHKTTQHMKSFGKT